jgi:hypothetical protein
VIVVRLLGRPSAESDDGQSVAPRDHAPLVVELARGWMARSNIRRGHPPTPNCTAGITTVSVRDHRNISRGRA